MIVPDDELSLAIGREGQNARLAAKLTGWRVDIKSESEFARGVRRGVRGRVEPRQVPRGARLPEKRMKAMLKEGRVSINGIVVRRYERLVGPEDVVAVDGENRLTRSGRAAVRTPVRRPAGPGARRPSWCAYAHAAGTLVLGPRTRSQRLRLRRAGVRGARPGARLVGAAPAGSRRRPRRPVDGLPPARG